MSAPNYSAADFQAAMLALMPRGRAWPKDLSSLQATLLAALSKSYERSSNSAGQLLVDAFPSSTIQLLPEWESSMGLPDPCDGSDPTLQARRDHVVARLSGPNGQSVPFITSFAAALGFQVTVTEFTSFQFGQAFGSQLNGDAWAYNWQINAPLVTKNDFTFGLSGFGEPFSSWGNTALECELQKISPAHSIVRFSYT